MDNIVGCINMLLYFLSQGNFYFKVVHWSFCQECQTNMEEGLGQVLWRKHIIPLANQTSAIGNDGALKLNDLTTHCEAKGEDTEHQFYFYFFFLSISLSLSFLLLKATSNITLQYIWRHRAETLDLIWRHVAGKEEEVVEVGAEWSRGYLSRAR